MTKSAIPVPRAAQEQSIPAESGSGSNDVAPQMELSKSWNRMQDRFLVRARDAVERGIREKTGISPQELLRRMDDRLAAAEAKSLLKTP
jgi:hypothetical protein